jgi:fluoroacetyl-CoA thioesterase
MLPKLLATPVMILALENAALDAIRDYLEPGESAVGTVVDVRRLAATHAEVTQVDGRRIEFSVRAARN